MLLMIRPIINSTFKDQAALGQSDSMNFSENGASDRSGLGFRER